MKAHLNVEKAEGCRYRSECFSFSGSVVRLFPFVVFPLLTTWKEKEKELKKEKSGGGEQMAVSQWHLALCLISGERVYFEVSVKSTFSPESEDRKWENWGGRSNTTRFTVRGSVEMEIGNGTDSLLSCTFNPIWTCCNNVLSDIFLSSSFLSLPSLLLSQSAFLRFKERKNSIHLCNIKRFFLPYNLQLVVDKSKKCWS